MSDVDLYAPHPEDTLYPPGPIPEEELWPHARTLFEDGIPATDVCDALKLAPSTFWKRAKAEGWLRRDNPQSVPAPTQVDPDRPNHDLETAMSLAWSRVCQALDDGHPGNAARWMRVHEQIKTSVIAERRAAVADDRIAEREKRTDDRRASHEHSVDLLKGSQSILRAAEASLALHKARQRSPAVEKVESNSKDSTPPDPDRPPNRAERRRRARNGLAP